MRKRSIRELRAELRERTLTLGVSVLQLSKGLAPSAEGQIIRSQLIRSATSVGANYRAVCRAKSRRDFIAKLGIVIEEADETLFWLDLIVAAGLLGTGVAPIREEVDQLVAIFTSARITTQAAERSSKTP